MNNCWSFSCRAAYLLKILSSNFRWIHTAARVLSFIVCQFENILKLYACALKTMVNSNSIWLKRKITEPNLAAKASNWPVISQQILILNHSYVWFKCLFDTSTILLCFCLSKMSLWQKFCNLAQNAGLKMIRVKETMTRNAIFEKHILFIA